MVKQSTSIQGAKFSGVDCLVPILISSSLGQLQDPGLLSSSQKTERE